MMTGQILAGAAGEAIPGPRDVPAEEWNPSGLVRLALEFGCRAARPVADRN